MNKSDIIISRNRWKVAASLLVVPLFLAISWDVWTDPSVKINLFAYLMSKYAMPPLSLFMLVAGIGMLIKKSPAFRADARGIYVYKLFGKPTFMPWSNFRSMKIQEFQKNRLLVFVYKVDPRPVYHLDRLSGISGFGLNQILVPMKLEELAAKILEIPEAAHLRNENTLKAS